MSREIKFRAWEIERKRMMKIDALSWITNSGCTDKQPSQIDASKSYYDGDEYLAHREISEIADDFILMQFAGLKDRDDKEIWEGDIFQTEKNRWPYIVVFEDGKFRGAPSRPLVQFNYEFVPAKMQYVKVIGNIYDDPELIEVV